MALEVAKGVFTAPTSTPPVDVTVNLSFVPKVLFLWARGATTTSGWDTYIYFGFGGATGASNEAAIAYTSEDSVNPSQLARGHVVNRTLNLVTTAPAAVISAELKSFNSGTPGFTVTFQNTNNAIPVHYLAIGGDDLTDATLVNFQSSGSTGDQTITSPGFQPDAIIFFGDGATVSPDTSVHGGTLIGFTDGTNDAAVCVHGYDNQSTTQANRIMSTTQCLLRGGVASDVLVEAGHLKQMESTGFTVTWDTITNPYQFYYTALCLKGGQYEVGTDTRKTSTKGTKKTTLSGAFQPTGLLLVSHGNPTTGSVLASASFSVGGTDGTNDGAVSFYDNDNVSPSQADRYITPSHCLTLVKNNQGIRGEADLSSFDSDGFTLNWDDGAGGNPDANADVFAFLAMGSEGAAPSILPSQKVLTVI